MNIKLIVLCSLFATLGCRHPQHNTSAPKTDLVDNAEVAATFAAHKNGAQHCKLPPENHLNSHRVIVTGFGLFGSRHNISGIAAMSMANAAFWPNTADVKTVPRGSASAFRHSDATTLNGAYILQRSLTIDSTKYEICFILLDVKWDLAASIILHEAALFKPRLVVMGGMNGAEPTATFFETGAVNEATLSSGFTSEGRRLPENIPTGVDLRVLQNMPVDTQMWMTWNATALAEAVLPVVATITGTSGHHYTAKAASIRTSNDYICNNTSFAVIAGLTGHEVRLAGEQITIPGQNTGTKVGFLHYPYESSADGRADNADQVFGWTKVLATVFRTELP